MEQTSMIKPKILNLIPLIQISLQLSPNTPQSKYSIGENQITAYIKNTQKEIKTSKATTLIGSIMVIA
jgi:archaellum component FlaG (FlaF/FlaG flagellin family)